MSDVPALDRTGDALEAAVLRGPRRRVRRAWWVGAATALAIAAPAAGTATDWAGLAGGETAVPTQVQPNLRVTLLELNGSRGTARLEAYRALLGRRAGVIGVCLFVSRQSGGTGRCAPEERLGEVVLTGDSSMVGVAAGALRGRARRVEITARTFTRVREVTRVVALAPAPAPRAALEARDLPGDLRPFALDGVSRIVGTRVLDDDGRTLLRSGRPAPARPDLTAQPSPATLGKAP